MFPAMFFYGVFYDITANFTANFTAIVISKGTDSLLELIHVTC